MRPAMRRAKKKKVKTPGGKFSYHRIGKLPKPTCALCHRELLGSRRERARGNLCTPCARKVTQEKVRNYAQKE